MSQNTKKASLRMASALALVIMLVVGLCGGTLARAQDILEESPASEADFSSLPESSEEASALPEESQADGDEEDTGSGVEDDGSELGDEDPIVEDPDAAAPNDLEPEHTEDDEDADGDSSEASPATRAGIFSLESRGIVPMVANTTVTSHDELQAAIDAIAADSDKEGTITVSASFTLTAAIDIPEGVDVTLTGLLGTEVITSFAYNNTRHFLLKGTLRLSNITLDGDGISGGILVGGTPQAAGGSLLQTKSGTVFSNCRLAQVTTGNGNGGAISMFEGSTASLSDTTFQDNYGVRGGAIDNPSGTLTINGCTFTRNTAVSSGGSISSNSPNPLTITNTSITDNKVTTGTAGGIAVGSYTTAFTMDNCTISGNTGTNGGGIYITTNSSSSASFVISNTRIADNTSTSNTGGGGGVWVSGTAPLVLEGCTISGNRATGSMGSGGGVYASSGSTLVINNSEVSGNTSNRNGGGINLAGGSGSGFVTFTMTNCVVKENTAVSHGGGLLCDNLSVTVINGGEIYDNEAGGQGGGLRVGGGGTTTTTVTVNGGRLHNNSAATGGGAYVANANTVMTLTAGSTVAENEATGHGGGVYVMSESRLAVLNSTLNDNYAGLDGGGIYTANAAYTNVSAANTTFTGNVAGNGGFWFDTVEHAVLAGTHAVQITDLVSLSHPFDKDSPDARSNKSYNNHDINYKSTLITLVYDANGGAYADSTTLYTDPTRYLTSDLADTAYTPTPVRQDYVFTGKWYTDPTCTPGTEWDFANDQLLANTVLYAEWEQKPTYTLRVIKVDADSGAGLSGARFDVLKSGVTVGSITTGADGKAELTGLDAGTYLLRETQAPSGYLLPTGAAAEKTVMLPGSGSGGLAECTVENTKRPDTSSSSSSTSSSSSSSSSSTGSSSSSSSTPSSTPSSSPSSSDVPDPTPPPVSSSSRPVTPPAVSSGSPGSTPDAVASSPAPPAAVADDPPAASSDVLTGNINLDEDSNDSETLTFGGVPLGGLSETSAWSLLNLLMSLISLLVGIVLLLTIIKRRRQDQADEDEDEAVEYRDAAYDDETPVRRSRLLALRLPAIILAVVPGILFLLLENLRLPMTWITRWTPLIGAFFIIHMVLVIIHLVVKKREKQEDHDDDDYAPQST